MRRTYTYKHINPTTGECIALLTTTRQRSDSKYVLVAEGDNISISLARRLAYNYAEIDLDTGECIGVVSATYEITAADHIRIPRYNEDYMEKYYINGAWYEDAEGTIPWSPEE